MIKTDGVCFYCNIASPSIIENDFIKYVDYDLDVKLYPGGGIRLLDEKEYRFNKKKYQYSDDLDKVLRYETEKIEKKMNERSFPFDEQKIMEYYEQYMKFLGR